MKSYKNKKINNNNDIGEINLKLSPAVGLNRKPKCSGTPNAAVAISKNHFRYIDKK